MNFPLSIYQEITEWFPGRNLLRLQGLSRDWYYKYIPSFYELRSRSKSHDKPLTEHQKHTFRLILQRCHLSTELFSGRKYTVVSLDRPNEEDHAIYDQNGDSIPIYWVPERPQWQLFHSDNGHWYHISTKLPHIVMLRTR